MYSPPSAVFLHILKSVSEYDGFNSSGQSDIYVIYIYIIYIRAWVKYDIISSDNGLSPVRHQAIMWANVDFI